MATRAPESIKELASFWHQHGGRNLGIVGDTKHKLRGTSYHLGRSDLIVGAYSTKLRRDRHPTLSASALDLGKLNHRIGKLRKFSNWLVGQAQDGLTPDIREIIWSPDGHDVQRWDGHQERIIVSLRRDQNGTPQVVNEGQGDATHYRHTHISFYRDSRLSPKIAYFEPFFVNPVPDLKPDDELEPVPDDDLVPDPDDELEPLPDDDPVPMIVKVKPDPHPRSTLSGIAREFDLTVKRLLAFPENEMFRANRGLVHAGQEVRVR
jgi:hypothetical protein